jgi:hypothetical protein
MPVDLSRGQLQIIAYDVSVMAFRKNWDLRWHNRPVVQGCFVAGAEGMSAPDA